MAVDPNGWTRYEALVLDKLDQLDKRMTNLEGGLVLVRLDVAMLKVKSGIWGGLAGMIPATIGIAAVLLGAGGS